MNYLNWLIDQTLHQLMYHLKNDNPAKFATNQLK